MTVDELIAQLQRFRGDLPVEVEEQTDYAASGWFPVFVRAGDSYVQIVGDLSWTVRGVEMGPDGAPRSSPAPIPAEMRRATPAFDYPSMIARYMDAVGRAEGVTFVDDFRGTDAEMAEMLRLEALDRPEDYDR